MREYLKSIRTREENLDDLKRRRKAVLSKADAAEKKLGRMNPEHKNVQQQAEMFNALRAEIRTLDSEIMSEEAALGDFKRATTKHWMGLKFGGLLECTEKGTVRLIFSPSNVISVPLQIVGEYGRLIITVCHASVSSTLDP